MARRRGSSLISALILVDKPAGWTSHDVVAKIKSAVGEGRIGHAGTLDPMATGLLVVGVGPATRLMDLAQAQSKEYRATITFGVTTATDDAEGEVLERRPVPAGTLALHRVEAMVAGMVGTHSQVPPAYSAIKVDGQRSYQAARAGSEVALKPREITIERVSLVQVDEDANTLTLDLTVSKGTYIRAIARDLGAAAGCGAHLSALRRTKSGQLTVDDAHSIQEIIERASHGVAALSELYADPVGLVGLPQIVSTDAEICSGSRLSRSDLHTEQGARYSVVSTDGRLLAIYEMSEEPGVLKANTVLSRPVTGPNLGECVVALGVFDGVHVGHQAIIRKAVAIASEKGVPTVAITHDPLPEVVVCPDAELPAQITSVQARAALLESLGVDQVVVVPFTSEVAALEPDRYLSEVLLSRVKPVAAVVGSDYRYGSRAEGTPELLGRTVPVQLVDEVDIEGHRARSTDTRLALQQGDIAHASLVLGRPVAVVGTVIRGQAIGASLGAPTANIVPQVEATALRHGVYAARVAIVEPEHDGAEPTLSAWRAYLAATAAESTEWHGGAVFVGRPSPNGTLGNFAFEVHILDANEDLYGKTLAVELIAHLRDPITARDAQALRELIAADLVAVRDVLARGTHHVEGRSPLV